MSPSPARPVHPSTSSNHDTLNDKENTKPNTSTKPSILHSPTKRQPATPPLSPRRDINAFSPSPLRLRIRGGGDEDESRNKENDAGELAQEGDGEKESRGEEEENAELVLAMADAAAASYQEWVVSYYTDIAESSGARDTAGVDGELDGAVVGEKGEEKEKSKKKGKGKEVAGTLSEDIKRATQALSRDDFRANVVVVWAEKGMQDAQTGSHSTADDSGKEKKQDESAVSKDQAGEGASTASKYVSPSDALMSPCTQQLNALKAKKISRGSESGVRSLFRDKLEKKEKTDDSGNEEN